MWKNIFDGPHLIVILILIIVLFGWKKLPDITRSVGRSARILKSEVDDMKAENRGKGSSASGQTVPGSVADNVQQSMSNFRQGFNEGQPGTGSHAAGQQGYPQQQAPGQQEPQQPQGEQGYPQQPEQNYQPQAGHPGGYPRTDEQR